MICGSQLSAVDLTVSLETLRENKRVNTNQSVRPSLIAIFLVFEHYLRLWVRKLIDLKHNTLWSSLAIFQFQLILINHGRKHQFDLVTGEPPSRTSVSAATELHLRFGNRCKLILFLIVQRGLSKVVEAQAVKSIRVRVDVWVEAYCVHGGKCKGARRYVSPVGKSDRSECFSLEGGC